MDEKDLRIFYENFGRPLPLVVVRTIQGSITKDIEERQIELELQAFLEGGRYIELREISLQSRRNIVNQFTAAQTAWKICEIRGGTGGVK